MGRYIVEGNQRIPKNHSSATNQKSAPCCVQRMVAILAGMATRKHGQGSYLNREVLYWLQFSITGRIFCGLVVILKTWHLQVKRMTSFLILQILNHGSQHHAAEAENGVTWEKM